MSFALGLACGIWLLQQQESLPQLPVYWPLVLLCLLLPRTLPDLWRQGLLLAGAALFGFSYAAFIADRRLADSLPDAWQGADIALSGVIAEMPRRHEHGLRFAFDVETVETAGAHVPRRILLSSYAAKDRPQPDMHTGERWRFTVRLKQPHAASNPHTPDFEVWALERGIRATGYIRDKAELQRLDEMAAGQAIASNTCVKHCAATSIKRWATPPMPGY